MTYEPLCLTDQANEQQLDMVRLTTPIVDHFETGDFEQCQSAITAYEKVLGNDKFSSFYLRQCLHHQQNPDAFSGCIVLEAK
ncbi:MAG: hypothetical protein JKX85_16200 [Phycisphaeraceae bacterium]|nr:hypothetical protein [Phycisphaeraceae bacterium]